MFQKMFMDKEEKISLEKLHRITNLPLRERMRLERKRGCTYSTVKLIIGTMEVVDDGDIIPVFLPAMHNRWYFVNLLLEEMIKNSMILSPDCSRSVELELNHKRRSKIPFRFKTPDGRTKTVYILALMPDRTSFRGIAVIDEKKFTRPITDPVTFQSLDLLWSFSHLIEEIEERFGEFM